LGLALHLLFLCALLRGALMIKKRVAILGANGKIGSIIAKKLSEVVGLEVVAVCRSQPSSELPALAQCQIRIDSISRTTFDKDVLADCDVVINCIWPAGSEREIYKQNKSLLSNVSNQLRIQQFINFSSVSVYGSCIQSGWNTFLNPRPDGLYGRSKIQMENAVETRFKNSTKSFHQIRLGHVYGYGQWLSRYILESAKNGRLVLPKDGALFSNSIHVEDIASAITALIEDQPKSGIYNLTSDPQLTWRSLVDWHTEAVGLSRVQSMGEEASSFMHKHYVQQCRRSSYPISFVLNKAKRVINKLSSKIIHYNIKSVKAAVNDEKIVGPIFFCDPMPGQYLRLSKNQSSKENIILRCAEIKEYYHNL
jgi:nucleoside-diphosphate-sugar epimerase